MHKALDVGHRVSIACVYSLPHELVARIEICFSFQVVSIEPGTS